MQKLGRLRVKLGVLLAPVLPQETPNLAVMAALEVQRLAIVEAVGVEAVVLAGQLPMESSGPQQPPQLLVKRAALEKGVLAVREAEAEVVLVVPERTSVVVLALAVAEAEEQVQVLAQTAPTAATPETMVLVAEVVLVAVVGSLALAQLLAVRVVLEPKASSSSHTLPLPAEVTDTFLGNI